MSFYVIIKKLNGRQDHLRLGDWLYTSGVMEVEYCQGGWQDQMIHNVAPHLKFEREDDALAYILANGGEYSKNIPQADPATIDWQ